VELFWRGLYTSQEITISKWLGMIIEFYFGGNDGAILNPILWLL
jgi:hypothetical protein